MELGDAELAAEFGVPVGSDFEEVLDGLKLFHQEYGIRRGLLRPEDPLRLFTEPPLSKNPLSWLFRRAAFEDRASELNYRLKRRRKETGRPPLHSSPMTVREYVLAWVGRE